MREPKWRNRGVNATSALENSRKFRIHICHSNYEHNVLARSWLGVGGTFMVSTIDFHSVDRKTEGRPKMEPLERDNAYHPFFRVANATITFAVKLAREFIGFSSSLFKSLPRGYSTKLCIPHVSALSCAINARNSRAKR
jgi:hypothetical protein